jgi:hypothetical protein
MVQTPEILFPWAGLVHQVRGWYSGRRHVIRLNGRSEEGEYPLWSSTDERQSSQPKDARPGGLR